MSALNGAAILTTDGDVWATINALRTAAEVYDRDAAQWDAPMPSMARQFRTQAGVARRIADELEAQS